MDEAFTPIKLNNGMYAWPEPFLGKTAFGLGWFLFTGDPSRKIVLHTGKQGGIVTMCLSIGITVEPKIRRAGGGFSLYHTVNQLA